MYRQGARSAVSSDLTWTSAKHVFTCIIIIIIIIALWLHIFIRLVSLVVFKCTEKHYLAPEPTQRWKKHKSPDEMSVPTSACREINFGSLCIHIVHFHFLALILSQFMCGQMQCVVSPIQKKNNLPLPLRRVRLKRQNNPRGRRTLLGVNEGSGDSRL